MPRFTMVKKTIGHNGHAVDLTLYGLNTVSGKRYFVSAYKGDEHNVFHIEQDKRGKWLLIGNPPKWALEVEEQLYKIAQADAPIREI